MRTLVQSCLTFESADTIRNRTYVRREAVGHSEELP